MATQNELQDFIALEIIGNSEVLKNQTIKKDITVHRCKVRQIVNCTFKVLKFENVSSSTELHIENCSIEKLEFINCSMGVINIKGGSVKWIATGVKEGQTACVIRKLTLQRIEEKIQIDYTDLQSDHIEIVECTGIVNLAVINSNIQNFDFSESNVSELFSISRGSSSGQFSLKGSAKKISIAEFNKNAAEVASIHFTYFDTKEIECLTSRFKKFWLYGEKVIDKLTVERTEFVELRIFQGKFNNVVIHPTRGNITLVQSSKIKIEIKTLKVVYYYRPNDKTPDEVKLIGLDCDELNLNSFQNRYYFELRNVTIKKVLSLRKVNLMPSPESKAVFNNVDLFNCKSVVLFDSFILGSKFFNIRWPSAYALNALEDEVKKKSPEEKINHYWTLKESYRQLKIVSTENSNKIDANFFHKGELDTYHKILSIKKRPFGDFVILSISKYFGGYGSDFFRPVFWWLVFHTFLFWILLYTADFNLPVGSLNDFNGENTWKGIKLYIQLLSPVHSNDMYGVDFAGLPDMFIRIVSGFFLYYIIRASRKFIE